MAVSAPFRQPATRGAQELESAEWAVGSIFTTHDGSPNSGKIQVAGARRLSERHFKAQTAAIWGWFPRQRPQAPAEIKTTLDRIAAAKIGYQPTIQVLEGERVYFEPEFLSSPDVSKSFPRNSSPGFR
jgi:hypothetical protein